MSMAEAMKRIKKESIASQFVAEGGYTKIFWRPEVLMGPRPVCDTSFQEMFSSKEKRATRRNQGVKSPLPSD
jgi:hypothetical protein